MTAFIWDLDGTLINSYDIILTSLEETFIFYNIPFDYEFAKKTIINESVVSFLKKISSDFDIPYEILKNYFSEKSKEKNDKVTLMEGALDILRWTEIKGIVNFIYTHKSDNALELIEKLGIREYFTEIVTSSNKFLRKPNPEGLNYLIDKYHLSLENTYYIGDRSLDVEVANNTGIISFNLTQPDSKTNKNISKLTDIIEITRNDFTF